MSNRQDKSDVLDKLIEAEMKIVVNDIKKEAKIQKTASDKTEPKEKKASEEKVVNEISFLDARVARRNGKFVKVASKQDLYQDVETNDFWKISDDKVNVVRLFEDSDK